MRHRRIHSAASLLGVEPTLLICLFRSPELLILRTGKNVVLPLVDRTGNERSEPPLVEMKEARLAIGNPFLSATWFVPAETGGQRSRTTKAYKASASPPLPPSVFEQRLILRDDYCSSCYAFRLPPAPRHTINKPPYHCKTSIPLLNPHNTIIKPSDDMEPQQQSRRESTVGGGGGTRRVSYAANVRPSGSGFDGRRPTVSNVRRHFV